MPFNCMRNAVELLFSVNNVVSIQVEETVKWYFVMDFFRTNSKVAQIKLSFPSLFQAGGGSVSDLELVLYFNQSFAFNMNRISSDLVPC